MTRDFRARLTARARLHGAFIKSPSWTGAEMLGAAGYDFIVIDEEHAPLHRESVDALILAARASGCAPLVRVPNAAGALQALDGGAEGVLVPHISTPEKAQEAVEACFYGLGRRGYSPSGRAGRYGAVNRAEHVAAQDGTVALVAMIEDPEALDCIDAICATPGVTALFIGRGDLTAALGAPGLEAPEVVRAVEEILAAGARAGLPVMMNVAKPEETARFAAQGASAFIIGSDQGFLRKAAAAALAAHAET